MNIVHYGEGCCVAEEQNWNKDGGALMRGYKGSIHIHTFCSGCNCYWSRTKRGGTAQDPTKSCGEHAKGATESKQGSQNRLLQRMTHLPSMPQALLWCHHSNSLNQKSEEKEQQWKEEQPANWRHCQTQDWVMLCLMPSQVLETSTCTSHTHAAHVWSRFWKDHQKKKQQKTNMNDCVLPSTIYTKKLNRA